MAIYKFECPKCGYKFESIQKFGTELIPCKACLYMAKRVHGQDLPSPAQIEIGVGGVYRGRFPERKYS